MERHGRIPSFLIYALGLLLALLVGACESDNANTASNPGTESLLEEEQGETTEEETTEEETTEEETEVEPELEPIGKEVGEAVPLDHDTAWGIVEKNVSKHMDGLETALSFLEDAKPIDNLFELLSEDDEEEKHHPEGEDEGKEDKDKEDKKDEEFEIDLSEIRDGLLEIFSDRLMVEETVTAADDGLSLTYNVAAEYFCKDDEDDKEKTDEAGEDKEEGPSEDEQKCAERLAKTPLALTVMSDGEDQVNITFHVGEDQAEMGMLQIHGEMMALSVNFSEFPTFLQVFVDPEDFELADTMTGILGCDVHDVASQNYEVRCSLPDGATAVPDSKQETFGFDIPAAPSLLHVTLDGSAATLDGSVGVDTLTANIPWQWVINLFHDDEGEEVEVCEEEPPCDDCEPSCWTEWVDGPEAPEVEGTAVIFLPGAGGSLAYNGDDDIFQLLGLNLGEESAQVLVDEATLVAIDLNPEAGRTLDLSLLGEDLNLLLQTSPSLDLQVDIGVWDRILEPLPDMWELNEGETLGTRLDGADAPTVSFLQSEKEEDVHVQVSAGTMTMWSSELSEDITVTEGQCMTSADDEDLSQEEIDAQHPMFGGIMGASCDEL